MAETQSLASLNIEERTRKDIEELSNSYSHPWDILAELAQNSVDAIREWDLENKDRDRDHQIDININKDQNSIKIEDTGIGIDPKTAPDLLAPHGTDKDDDNSTIGEKGVGLTYCIYSSNEFEINTASTEGNFTGELHDARDWWQNKRDVEPELEYYSNAKSNEPDETGTEIVLSDIEAKQYENEDTIFDISDKRIIHSIRTKTAIGYTRSALRDDGPESDDPDIDVSLTVIDNGNKTLNQKNVEFKYYFPHEAFDDSDTVNVKEDILSNVPMTDNQKKRKLSDKNLKLTGKKTTDSGKTVRFYAFYMPGADWENLSQTHGLVGKNDADEVAVVDMNAGIQIATRGMPSGIKMERPRTGLSGYWAGIFMILEYDEITFDLGRKYLTGEKPMLQSVAKEIYNDDLTDWIGYTQKQPPTKPTTKLKKKQDYFDELHDLSDISANDIKFKKEPDGQEAGVVTIFHELIGAEKLKHYHGLRAGYKQTYDFWGTYEIYVSELPQNTDKDDFYVGDISSDSSGNELIQEDIVVEFKHSLSDITNDFDDDTKEFDMIDLIVCWEVDDHRISSMDVDDLPEKEARYQGANYEMIIPSSAPVNIDHLEIICLEDIVN